MGIPPDKIGRLRIMTPFLLKRYWKQKQGILDVAAVLNDDIRMDIELQIHPQKYWVKRNLFYLAKMYEEDLKAGQRYDCLRKCILISILDFALIPGGKYYSRYTLRDNDGGELTDLFEIHIIELKKELKGQGAVDEWIRLFNVKSQEELDMIKTKNTGIAEAINAIRAMNLGGRLRMTYEAHLKAVRDRWAEDEYVRDMGREEGRKEGKAEGKEEGRIEGKKEGKAEGKADSVLQILNAYGELPSELQKRIASEKDMDTLNVWLLAAAKAESLEAFRKNTGI